MPGSSATMPPTCRLHVHGRLVRFLRPRHRADAVVDLQFDGSPALKDPVEAAGIPHAEIGEARVDGVPRSLKHRLRGGERLDVAPVLRQDPGRPPRFVLDVHLGRLAVDLRLLGIDTGYENDADDHRLQAVAADESRVLLTRDTGLLKRTDVTRGAFIYATDPSQQLVEVVDRFGLAACVAPFTRCSCCNGVLQPVDAASLRNAVPEAVHRRFDRFSRCCGCGRIYWSGSHEARLRDRFSALGLIPRAVHLPGPDPIQEPASTHDRND